MKKNTASQKWRVYAWHRNTSVPATGIAATITATINKDFAGEVATDDTNPTEIGGGYYEFDLTQAETNAYQLSLTPTTTTNGVGVQACPETLTTETAAAVDPSTLTTADVDARLAAIHLDHLLAVDYDPASKPGVATALLNELVESDSGVSRFTANALEQGPSGSGGDATEAKQDTIIALLGTPADTDVSTDIANLQTSVDALDIGAGTGSNTIQFEITDSDGGAALEGAKVTLRLNGILKATADTDETGRLDGNGLAVEVTGTYELAVTCDGFNGYTDDLVVTAGENTMVEVALDGLTYPDSTEPDTVTIRWKVKLGVGRVTAGADEATVYVRMKAGSGDAGFAYGTRQDSDATDASGYVYFANVPVGGTISAKLGSAGAENVYDIPDDATTPYDMGELIGDA